LHVEYRDYRVDFPVGAFYDELLPRLRSFRLAGVWPETAEETDVADVVLPLPLLEDLKWCSCEMLLPRRITNARPFALDCSLEDLIVWRHAADCPSSDPSRRRSPTCGR
jgi:hypothetical protein